MRLNIYLPFRKTSRRTGPPSRLRRVLKRIGDSWLQSPFRRSIQAICFVAFMVLFFYVCWPYTAQPDEQALAAGQWPSHYADDLATKEIVDAEVFLAIDPLLSISTAIAARTWVWSLGFAAVILLICVFIPRGFCGYICPLGTLIDLFDWAIGRRVTRFRVSGNGWWVHLKYYILLASLAAAMGGVLITGFVAAIPVITRGLLFIIAPLQMGTMRGWHQVPPMNAGHFVSIALFLGVLGLGFFSPRFWCKYVCPTGAVFSLGNLLRATQRKVTDACIKCNKCVEVCPFDAIKPDFTTRTNDCTLCQTCGGACPTQAIQFVERWGKLELKMPNDPPTHETVIGRRGFIASALGVSAGVVGGVGAGLGISLSSSSAAAGGVPPAVRPPGSVPESDFLNLCIRCGECFKACPNNVLQPMGFSHGLNGLWTPEVAADWSGCDPSCNNCGQVCPTGAIRALPIEEKRHARMGLAIVNEATCLPHADRQACQLCVDECTAAGYHAIEFIRVHVAVDEEGHPIEDTGYLAPVVRDDLCVGCGLCQSACHRNLVRREGLLDESAIIIEAGEGYEDRMHTGSYLALREAEQAQRRQQLPVTPDSDTPSNSYLPDFLQ